MGHASDAALAATIEASVVYLNAPYELEFRKEVLAADGLGSGDILCETLVSAISPGTELGAFTGLPPLRPGTGYPRLMGYCNVSRILAVGTGVRDLQRGDRVLSFASHRSHFILQADDILLPVPAELDSDGVACTYLFQLGYDAVLRSAVRPGSRVLVVGLGVLGLASVAMAHVAGARVFALSDHPVPRRIAQEFGAVAAFDRNSLQELRDALADRKADVIVATTNGWQDWRICLEMAGLRGTIVSLGFPGRGEPPRADNPLDSEFFYAKQLQIMAARVCHRRSLIRADSCDSTSARMRGSSRN